MPPWQMQCIFFVLIMLDFQQQTRVNNSYLILNFVQCWHFFILALVIQWYWSYSPFQLVTDLIRTNCILKKQQPRFCFATVPSSHSGKINISCFSHKCRFMQSWQFMFLGTKIHITDSCLSANGQKEVKEIASKLAKIQMRKKQWKAWWNSS